MHYPFLANYVSIRKVGNRYLITNESTAEKFITTEYGDERFIHFISQLNGKVNPYLIPSPYSQREVAGILNQLKEFHLIREDRWLMKGIRCFAYSLYIPKEKTRQTIIPCVLNALLYLSFPPALIAGFFCLSKIVYYLNQISISGILSGYLLGITLHEAGHAIAALSCKEECQVYELGIQVSNLVVPGAYTMIKKPDKLKPINSIMIDAAGIVVNCIISGVSFILAEKIPILIDFFYCIGIVNLSLAFLNIAVLAGNDGESILSTLLGVEGNISDLAGEVLFNKSFFSYLFKKGSAGKATICACSIIMFMQIGILCLIITNVLGVISWF